MSSRITNLDVVFRDATDPILIEDLDGIVIDLNEQAVRTYGFAREDLIGQPSESGIHNDIYGETVDCSVDAQLDTAQDND